MKKLKRNLLTLVFLALAGLTLTFQLRRAEPERFRGGAELPPGITECERADQIVAVVMAARQRGMEPERYVFDIPEGWAPPSDWSPPEGFTPPTWWPGVQTKSPSASDGSGSSGRGPQ